MPRTCSGYRCPRKGFTVVEMLVVMSIILLLLAMLLPSMRAARETARLAVCMAQTKQLHLLHLNYAADYFNTTANKDAYLRYPIGYPGWPNVADIVTSNVFVVKGYMPEETTSIYMCPSDTGYREDHPELAGAYKYIRPANFSYTRSVYLDDFAAYPKLNKIKMPAHTCLLAEEKETAPMNDASFWSNPWDLMTTRHNDRCGMVFIDGHTDYIDGIEYNEQTFQWRIDMYLNPTRN
ncbi:MAG: prepilin-type N-terminal cleavage/methylation domain-containing protein [Phycisphaera sp.]|nr:prepilin-type N-terminal cleavage/methylation domain-containing protein [Phycisphaera sp.]